MKTKSSSIHGRRRGAAGFTLIELLVVVLIIGILAALAIPQYFKVVERARTGEALAFISVTKASQERYSARTGGYLTALANPLPLDVVINNCTANSAGATSNCGMKNFGAALGPSAACATGYTITLTRCSAAPCSNVSAAYGAYTITYDKCTDLITFVPAAAQTDLGQ